MHYVAKKVLRVGQVHYQAGDVVPGAASLSNLNEMVADGYLAATPEETAVPALLPTTSPASPPRSGAMTPPMPTRLPVATPSPPVPRPAPTTVPVPGVSTKQKSKK